MKRLPPVLLIGAVAFSSCQNKAKVLPSDLTAAKVAVTKVLDSHWSALKAKDADAMIALVTEDFLFSGIMELPHL